MDLLRYYRVGKTTLPRGVPFLAMVQLDGIEGPFTEDDMATYFSLGGKFLQPRPAQPTYLARGVSSVTPSQSWVPYPHLWFVPPESDQDYPQEPFSFRAIRNSEDGRFLFNIPTDMLPPGAFELSIQTGIEERIRIEEEVWILERDHYRELANDIVGEEFLPSPPLQGGQAVANYVADLIRQELEEHNFLRDPCTRFRFDFTPSAGELQNLFPASPIRWTTEQVVQDFRQLALWGLTDVVWTMELADNRYTLQCEAQLDDILSGAAVKSVLDLDGAEGGPLHLLRESTDLVDLSIDWNFEGGSRAFFLRVGHRIDGFEIAESERVAN